LALSYYSKVQKSKLRSNVLIYSRRNNMTQKYHVWGFGNYENYYCGVKTRKQLEEIAEKQGLELCEAFRPGDLELCTPTEISTEESIVCYEASPTNN